MITWTEQSVEHLKRENNELKKQNEVLSSKVEPLSGTLKDVVDTVGKTQHHQERLETDSKRLNLKFYGIEESLNESPAENEQKMYTKLLVLRPHTLSLKAYNDYTVGRVPDRYWHNSLGINTENK